MNIDIERGDKKAQTITVALSGGNFTSIKSAIDSIIDSSSDKRYIVQVFPGEYVESPFTIPSYVSLLGVNQRAAEILKTDENTNLITLSANSEIKGFSITGPSNADVIIVNNVGNTRVEDCSISNSNHAIHVSGASGRCTVFSVDFTNNVRNVFADTSSTLTVLSARVTLGAYGLYADDATIDARNTILAGCTSSGIFATNGSRVTGNMSSIVACSYGIRIGLNSEFDASNIRISAITNEEIVQDDDTASILITAAKYDSSKRTITNWDNVELDGIDVFPGNKAYEISNELHVGVPELGREAAIGEGDSYTRGMKVYTYNGSTYTDISTEAGSSTGSTFTFPNVNTNTAIYMASSLENGTKVKSLGLRAIINTAVTLGGGSIVAEYYNGAWTEFETMTTEADADYFPEASNIFEHEGSHHIRYDCKLPVDWTASDDPSFGTVLFWVRFRIASTITTAPVFEQWRLHSNHTEMNADGWLEYFGTARPLGRLSWDMSVLEAVLLNNPSDQDLYLSDTIGVGRVKNKFLNSATDRTAFNAFLPFDYDTSCPLRLVISYITDDASAGNIRYVIRWGFTKDGDNVYRSTSTAPSTGPNEQNVIGIILAPTVADTVQTSVIELDTSSLVSRRTGTPNYGDILWVALERDGTHADDTHSGDVSLIQFTANYTKWCEGGHA